MQKLVQKVIVSTPKFEYETRDAAPTPLIHLVGLSFRKFTRRAPGDKIEQLEYTTLQAKIKEVEYSGTLLTLEVESPNGIVRTLTITPAQTVYTRFRGVIAASKLNLADVLIDECGNMCKILKATKTTTELCTKLSVQANGMFCYFCDGILIGVE